MEKRSGSGKTKWAVVTPSYSVDYERCKLLCRSMDEFVEGDWHHYIFVATADLPLFRGLSSPRRSVLDTKSVLPPWIHRTGSIPGPYRRSIWFSFRTGFVSGWRIQQIVKMNITAVSGSEGFIFCDSDMFFAKPFDVSSLSNGGRIRFFRTHLYESEADFPNSIYLKTAAKLLGLQGGIFPARDYVDNLVTWGRPMLLALRDQLEKVSGRDWISTLMPGGNVIISEYSLYGLFADRIAEDTSSLEPTSSSLCRTAWHPGDWSDAALANHIESMLPCEVAVGFQSFLEIDVKRLERLFETCKVRSWS